MKIIDKNLEVVYDDAGEWLSWEYGMYILLFPFYAIAWLLFGKSEEEKPKKTTKKKGIRPVRKK